MMPLLLRLIASPCVLQEAEPKLPNLLKLLMWAQKQLDEKAVYPRVENLVTAELHVDGGN